MAVALALGGKGGCEKEDSQQNTAAEGGRDADGKERSLMGLIGSHCSRGFFLQKSDFRKEDSFPLCCFGS